MTWRVLRTELLRGAAPVVAAGVLLTGALSMYELTGGWSGWPGRWMSFAASVRMSLYVIGAVTVACAAWQAGRERRRRVGEQIAGTARPRWQPFLVAWAAVTVGACLSLLVLVGVGVVLVAPVATYWGGGWQWVLAVAFPGLAALSAVGTGLGRLVPSRLVAPVAGIVTYLAMVGVHDTVGLGGARWLAPILSQYDAPGYLIPATASGLQALWFLGCTATVLLLVGTRRRWLAAVPAGVAAAGALPLLAGPGTIWVEDTAALQLVCVDDGGPEVCVPLLEAFLLDDVSHAAREVFARWDGVPGGPERAISANLINGHQPAGYERGSHTLVVQVDAVTLTGALGEPSPFSWWPERGCDSSMDFGPAAETTAAWGAGLLPDEVYGPEVREAYENLVGMPEADQKDWITQVLDAYVTCDDERIAELQAELG